MNTIDLNALASSLISDKWMLSHINYANLVSQVQSCLNNPSPQASLTNPQATGIIKQDEFTTDSNSNLNEETTAVIEVSGVLVKGATPEAEAKLGLVNTDYIAQCLDDAANDPQVKDICLIFNSPGGSTKGIEELGRKIAAIDQTKPVYGWVDQQACSAAYWLLSQCRAIAMTPSATVGAIGVYAIFDDMSGALKDAGISKQAISSGKYKLLGANFKPLSEDERSILQDDVTKTHEQFKSVIQARREVKPEYMEGLSYSGNQALAGNLVDMVMDDINQFLTTANINNMKSYTKVTKAQAETPAAPTVAVPQANVSEVTKHAEDMKKENVPGVPGTKAESGHYGGGYIACPACKLTYKLEDSHYVDGPKAKDAEPAEPKEEKAEIMPDEGKDNPADTKKEPEDKLEDKEPEKKAMTFAEWRDHNIGAKKKALSPFHAATKDWQLTGKKLSEI